MPREYGACECCKEKFETKHLLQNSDNTYYCKECFRRKYCQGSGDQKRTKPKHSDRRPQKLIPFPDVYSLQRNHNPGLKNMTPSMISLSKSAYCSKTNLQTMDYRPVMILLATRISGYEMEKMDREENGGMFKKSDVELDSSKTFVQNDILLPNDKIIIWMASNIFTTLSYTVAVSTLSNKIRQKYFGPMLTLGDNSMDLWREGKCLILTHFHINGMSENGVKPLALDIVIHSPD